jgi:hypothetical protein
VTTSAGDAPNGEEPAALDRLADLLALRSGVRFTVATSVGDRAEVHALRRAAVEEGDWADGGRHQAISSDEGDGGERDAFDERAVHVLGRRDGLAVCCGRLVLPPGPLPTELACEISITPAGEVVDVGRMVVAPAARGRDRSVFLALLSALYLETRSRGFTIGCGMMAPNVRALMRHLGVHLDVLGHDRDYWGAQRAPVRFDVALHGAGVVERWA